MPKIIPITMCDRSVRLNAEGRKTETRRVVTNSDFWHTVPARYPVTAVRRGDYHDIEHLLMITLKCPYGRAGDLLWVRESHRFWASELPHCIYVEYAADNHVQLVRLPVDKSEWPKRIPKKPGPWRPPRYLWRWACRQVLEVGAVLMERLLSIQPTGAFAEGITTTASDYAHPADVPADMGKARIAKYLEWWDVLNGKRFPAPSNPLVYVVRYKTRATDHAAALIILDKEHAHAA